MLRFIPPFWSGHNKAGKRTCSAPLKKAVGSVFSVPTVVQKRPHTIPGAANDLLRKAVAFSDGDRAASVSRFGGEVRIEWKNLSVRRIAEAPLTEEDYANGIFRRCYAHLGCDAHRRRDGRTGRWTAWESHSYTLFPSAIVVEMIYGRFVARADGIETFVPAPVTLEPPVEFPQPLLATA